jgi:hypothetical protein
MIIRLTSSEEYRRIVWEIGSFRIYLVDYVAYIPGDRSLNIHPFYLTSNLAVTKWILELAKDGTKESFY